MNLTYTKQVLKHLKSPKNMGEIKNADGVGTVGNPICGDIMRIFIKMEKKKNQEFIKDIKFQTLGCGAAIATSSVLTTLAKGKTLTDAQKITKEDIIQALGGLPSSKIHCSVLADQALEKAIADYQSKKATLKQS
jgi:nitrogen fixation NifU-like protein